MSSGNNFYLFARSVAKPSGNFTMTFLPLRGFAFAKLAIYIFYAAILHTPCSVLRTPYSGRGQHPLRALYLISSPQ